MKMDHHCPWSGSCIGIKNHKLFNLLLFYVDIVCFYSLFSMGIFDCILAYGTEESKKAYELNLVSKEAEGFTAFGSAISLLMGLFVFILWRYQMNKVVNNTSTLEWRTLETFNPFHKEDGWFGFSWQQHFGKNWWLWLLPIPASFDEEECEGMLWPLRIPG